MGNDCRMTIDGVDFCILQKGVAKKGISFASHKYGGKFTLRFELGIDILAGNLVWIQVFYSAGKYMDIKFSTSFCRTSSSLANAPRLTRATASMWIK
jgi:hypothetical protein